MKKLPLEGYRVIELGTFVAVPATARVMAEMGAEVIKAESIEGDDWRPTGLAYNMPSDDNENMNFTVENSNKKFISLNLKDIKGRQILLMLMEGADVFISNVRYKSLQNMGLDYESIKERFSKLIYFHLSGYGHEGDQAGKPGFDLAAFWSRVGLIDWAEKALFPPKPINAFGDIVTSNINLVGVLTALLARERTGKGCFVEGSLLGSGIWCSSNAIVSAQDVYGYRFPESTEKPISAFSHFYKCSDGEWLNLAILNPEKHMMKIIDLLELGDLFLDDKFVKMMTESYSSYIEANGILYKRLSLMFKSRTRDEWAGILDESDFVNEKMAHIKDVLKDSQAWDNGYLEEITFPSGTKAVIPKYPIKFSEYEMKKSRPADAVGCDTREILTGLGYGDDKIDLLRQEKIIQSR